MPTILDRDHLVRGLDDSWVALIELGAELSPEDWGKPTDCPGWTVKDQFSHIIGTESLLLGRPTPDVDLPGDLDHIHNDVGRLNEFWVEFYRNRSGAEVIADLSEVVTSRRAVVSHMDQDAFDEEAATPAGPDTYGRFMRLRVMDQWVHEQDVRLATGRPGHLEGLAPELTMDEVGSMMGFVVGKKAGVPAGKSVRFDLTTPVAREILVAVGERGYVVPELAGQPTSTVSLPGDHFIRLACGRMAHDDPRVQENLKLEGDAALGQKVIGNLAYMI
jgi:uncharacterized protein (TIGR03083 family)